MLLLLDIGNTHTHAAIATARGVVRTVDFPTSTWRSPRLPPALRTLVSQTRAPLQAAALCSVVPQATTRASLATARLTGSPPLVLTHRTAQLIRIDYPRPATIGPDRLANATAALHYFGAPSVVVDFGTAVTFDVINAARAYVGGIIAPGLAAMTSYLHEKTALLPRISIREVRGCIGRTTRQAMLIGAVHGYRGLVRELLHELRTELKRPNLPVVATGGYARLIAAGLPEISAVRPNLTLEGLRLSLLAAATPLVQAPRRR